MAKWYYANGMLIVLPESMVMVVVAERTVSTTCVVKLLSRVGINIKRLIGGEWWELSGKSGRLSPARNVAGDAR